MNKLGFKVVAVVAITIGLLVPLVLIRGLVAERTRYRSEAVADIAGSWTGSQKVMGPLLVVPPRSNDPAVAPGAPCLFVLPESVEIQASLRTESRKRGLYSVPVYSTRLLIAGEFDLSGLVPAGDDPWVDLDPDAAYLAVSFSDNRGLVDPPELIWAGDEREFASGSTLVEPAEGIHAVVGPLESGAGALYPFRMEIELRGLETLEFAPVGKSTRVVMDAEWSHPSFVGRFLPVDYQIEGGRFTAEWKVSGLASGQQRQWFGNGQSTASLLRNPFGVSLINPVDIYQQAERSVKYGNLIVLLTFTAFFLVEMVRRLVLHPVQYLLVGLALVIFFLLLLALSEHLPFWAAYLVAATACVGLVGIYMTSALQSVSNGAGVTATLAGLYGMLYAILISEDNALLMGSLLLFFALAAVMMVTRRIDWYALGRRLGPEEVVAEAPAHE